MSTFQDRIIQLRNHFGLTQKDAADKIGIPRSTLANYERGDREPDARNLAALARFYNVSVDYILGIEDEYGQDLTPKQQLLFYTLKNAPEKDVETAIKIIEALRG